MSNDNADLHEFMTAGNAFFSMGLFFRDQRHDDRKKCVRTRMLRFNDLRVLRYVVSWSSVSGDSVLTRICKTILSMILFRRSAHINVILSIITLAFSRSHIGLTSISLQLIN